MQTLINLIKNDDGVTAIEYALIAALIALAIITSAIVVGQSLNDIFNSVSNAFGGS